MEKQPIHVLQIIGITNGGGVEAVILNYYGHIDRRTVQFDFVVHNDSPVDITKRVEELGGKVYKITPYTKNIFTFIHDIYRIIKQHHYDIVHSNMNTLSAFVLFAAWLAGARIRILHNHSTSVPSETKRNIMKIILRPFAKLFANRYFACSKLAAEWMYGKKAVEEGKVTIIHNAIDLNKYAFNPEKRKALRKQLGISDDTFVVGHVGRFMYQKNHEFLIDIFAEVVKQRPNSKLLLVGDGPLRAYIEDKVKRLGLTNKVLFLGLRSDVQDLYNVMDVFCLPSYYEGLPVVGVESQANGLPSVISDNVTKEVGITKILTFQSLKYNARLWTDILENYEVRNKALNTRNKLTRSGFNINFEAKNLVERYMKYEKGRAN